MENKQVYSAMAEVAAALSKDGIRKDRQNKQQNYSFRGIDEVLNALSGLLVDAGLVIIPTVLNREWVERETKSGGALFYVTVQVKFTVYCVADGSTLEAVTYGEAMDSADKATNKAMSAAYKYFAFLSWCIPTEGDNDADATTHDVRPAAQPAPDGSSLTDRAKAMTAPTQNPIPPQVLTILDKLDNMDAITAKCAEYKPMAKKEGWERAMNTYWRDRNQKFKDLQNEVFPPTAEEGN